MRSLIAPYAWKDVTLSGLSTRHQRRRLSGFKRYGTHIQTLTCHVVTKSTLKTISRRQNLTNLQALHLTLDRKSIWVTYKLLEKAFLSIQERLSTVSIKFDAEVLDTRLLWSLSQLPFLENLSLDTDRYYFNSAQQGLGGSGGDLCKEILRCCAGLRSLRMDSGYTYKQCVPAFVRFRTAVQGKVARRFERLPVSLGDVIGRQREGECYEADSTISKKRNFSSNMAQDQQQEQRLASGDMPLILKAENDNIGHSLSGGSNLRRLQLRQCSLDTNVLLDVVKQTSQLEELDLQSLLYRGGSDILRILSQHCRFLRTLRLSGHNEGMSIVAFAKLLWGLPHLETFFISLNNSEVIPWQSLDTHLAEFELLQQEQDRGGHHHHRQQKRHPLKTLWIKGYYKETLSTLLEILSIQSLAIETLTVGSPWFFQIFVEHTPGNLYSSFAPLVDRQTPSREIFSRAWSTLKDSLTRLDMSTTILVDRDVAAKFFGRLQELVNLRGLYLSARHVQDWFPKDFIVGLPPSLLTPGPTDDDNSTDPNSDGSNSHQIIDDINQYLPTGIVSLPSLRDVIVRGEDRNVPMPFELTVPETVFLISVAPCLEYLYLKAGSVSEANLESLKRVFPDYLRPMPKERLDWIDESTE